MLVVIYGINGVGKNTVAAGAADKGWKVLSRSRLLMYHLGLTRGPVLETELVREAYYKLESIEEKKIDRVRNTLCAETIVNLSNQGEDILYLSHLVVVKHQLTSTEYVLPDIPAWEVREANGLVFLKAKASDILSWRKADERARSLDLNEIKKHQRIAEKRWENIKGKVNLPTIIVWNQPGRVEKASKVLSAFLNKVRREA